MNLTHAAAILLAALVSCSCTSVEAGSVVDQAESVVVDQRVAESDAKAARWAGARFAEAQLPLPAIRVSFYEDQEPCNGARGLARLDDGVSRVQVCVPGDAIARDLKVKRTLLHEYAHLWDHFSLTDEVRAEFMAHRGSSGWLEGSGLPYEEQAGEQAAENIMWGLIDEPLLVGTLSDPWPWKDLRAGYGILTGSEPPHGYVWSFFAVTHSHSTYSRTPAQLEVVKEVWEQLETGDHGVPSGGVQIRFHRDPGPCRGATIQSRLVAGRLHVEACPASRDELSRELLEELR